MIERNQRGFIQVPQSGRDAVENRLIADMRNERIGVSKAQEAAMVAGSMFGWGVPAANPRRYDKDGRPKKPRKMEMER